MTGPVEDLGWGVVICIQWSCSLQIYQEIRARSRRDESPAAGIVQRRLTGRGVLGSNAGLRGLSSPESGLMSHLCALCLFLPPFAQRRSQVSSPVKCTFLGAWDPTGEFLTSTWRKSGSQCPCVRAHAPCPPHPLRFSGYVGFGGVVACSDVKDVNLVKNADSD